MKKSEFLKTVDTLPYPVVVINEKREILHRNRLAQKLLPPLHRLRMFFQSKKAKDFGVLGEALLDGIRYYVGTAKGEAGLSAVCFLESFLPFYDQFSRVILEKMQTFFWDAFSEYGTERTEEKARAELNGIAARTYRLRREEQIYLRLLNMKEHISREAAACSLFGFLGHLEKALGPRGIRISSLCPDRAVVKIPPSALSFLVLNLVQFAYLFEGEQELSVKVEPRGRNYHLSVSFADPGHIADSLEGLMRREGDKDPRLLLSLPLLCALSLCREEGILWHLKAEKERAVFSFSLPGCNAMPDAFLSQVSAEEVKELVKMERELFSWEKNREKR